MDKALSAYPGLEKLTAARNTIRQSERARVSGNDAFAKGSYEPAAEAYSNALRLVEPTNNYKLKGILLANRAAARMAQRRWERRYSASHVLIH